MSGQFAFVGHGGRGVCRALYDVLSRNRDHLARGGRHDSTARGRAHFSPGQNMPSATARLDQTLDLIEDIVGQKGREMVALKVARMPSAAAIGDALSIGGFRGVFGALKSDAETRKRGLARAIVLTRIAFGNAVLVQSSIMLDNLMMQSAAELERLLRAAFPFQTYSGDFARRTDWSPERFTTAKLHNDQQFRYIVHSIMGASSQVASWFGPDEKENFMKHRERYLAYGKVETNVLSKKQGLVKRNLQVDFFREYLDDPHIVRKNIISSSVISEAKRSTYYPFGFIMRVPAECVYITSDKDVAVKNRTSDINAEFKAKSQGALRSPTEILNATSGTGGDTGYNEIVVVGSAPTGQQVTVTGIFVKTDAAGNLYVRPANAVRSADTAPYVTPELQRLIADSARRHNLPVVPIIDTTSLPSTTPWPFGALDRSLDFARAPLPSRARRLSF
jgi:hypothetical protein